MRFHLTANAKFEAHDLHDAQGQLTQHFADMMGGQLDGDPLDCDGHITLEPADQDPEALAIVKRGWWRRLADAVGSRA